MEILIGIIIVVLLASILLGPILATVALVVLVNLRRRVAMLEQQTTQPPGSIAEGAGDQAESEAESTSDDLPYSAELVTDPIDGQDAEPPADEPAFNWEVFLGRKGLGWLSVLLLLFGVAFFLRYAFENNWIGPMGQIALGAMAGTGLVVFGWWCECRRGWSIFSRIVTSAGLLLLYLSTFAAFGYYTILTQQIGGLFLLLIVAAGAMLAVVYDARSLALMTVIGGLLVPLLMQSPHDLYEQLFVYLVLLNAGILLITFWRRWSIVGVVALLGTHIIFWLWYAGNYHPEKLSWAIVFHVALWALFAGHSLTAHVVRRRQANVLDLIRLTLTAFFWFLAAYVLLKPDFEPWLGSVAVGSAAIYAGWSRMTLWQRSDDARQTVVALSIAVSFASVALPIQADAHWVALGWAAESAALWWFGLRLRSGYPLRGMAVVLVLLAVMRVVVVDTPWETRDPFIPIVNKYALPSLFVAVCLIGSVLLGLRHGQRLHRGELLLLRIAGLAGVLLVWTILSIETYGYFDAVAALEDTDALRWRWLGQMALSAMWAIYASAILVIGFWKKRTALRWTALALYALTIGKVFLADMAGLAELYRIGAFVVVAVVVGMAAWAYQRFAPQSALADNSSENSQ